MGLLDTLKGAYNKYASGEPEPSSGASFQEINIPEQTNEAEYEGNVANSRRKTRRQMEELDNDTIRTIPGRAPGSSKNIPRPVIISKQPIVEDSSVYGTDTTVQDAADLLKNKATEYGDKLKSIWGEYNKERAAQQAAQPPAEPQPGVKERLSGAFKQGAQIAGKGATMVGQGATIVGAGVNKIISNPNLRNNLGMRQSTSNDEYMSRLNETIMANQNDINNLKSRREANETQYREFVLDESNLQVERKSIMSVAKKDRTPEQNAKLNEIERKLSFIGNFETVDNELKKLEDKRQVDQLNLMNQRNNYIMERNNRVQQQRSGRSEIGRRLQNIGDATSGQFAPSLPKGIGEGLNSFGYNRGTGMADNLGQVVGGVNGRQPMYERLSTMVNTRGAGDTSGMRAMTDALVTIKQNKVVAPFGAPGIASEGIAAKEFDKTVPFRRIMLSDVGVGINARIIPKQFRQNVLNNTVHTNIDTKPQPVMLQPAVQEQAQDQEVQYRKKKGSKAVANRFHEKGMAAIGSVNSIGKINGLVNFRKSKESTPKVSKLHIKSHNAGINIKTLNQITDSITKVAQKTVNKKRIGKKK
jgi:hypothetical protein